MTNDHLHTALVEMTEARDNAVDLLSSALDALEEACKERGLPLNDVEGGRLAVAALRAVGLSVKASNPDEALRAEKN